jgi:HEPN domain-containing protein
VANSQRQRPNHPRDPIRVRAQDNPIGGSRTTNGTQTHSTPEERNSRLARNLLQNAESFFQEAVSYIERGDGRDWVFAVLNLSIALELTLKAVLQAEHWSLVFDDIGAASKQALQTGHFRSVAFQEALERTKQICGVRFDAKDLRYLGQLNDLRNQVLHFGFDLNIEQVKGLVARGLNIFNHLMTTRLGRGRDLAFEISGRLVKFERYVTERLRILAPRVAKSRRPPSYFRECERCGQDALILRDGLPLCLYCGSEPSPSELARNTEGDFGPCPNCEHGRLGFILWNNDEGEVLCVLCGFRADGTARNRVCDYCGGEFWDEGGESLDICSNCR